MDVECLKKLSTKWSIYWFRVNVYLNIVSFNKNQLNNELGLFIQHISIIYIFIYKIIKVN